MGHYDDAYVENKRKADANRARVQKNDFQAWLDSLDPTDPSDQADLRNMTRLRKEKERLGHFIVLIQRIAKGI